MDFARFILEHDHDDTGRLALERDRHAMPDFALALSTLEARRKLRGKLPQWHALPGLHYPSRLCAEQCSSAETAAYKAAVAAAVWPEARRIADLTGGIGADSWAFARRFEAVLHNEPDPALAAAVRHNFPLLGLRNVAFRQRELVPGGLQALLEGFVPDILYLDPARRAADGRKVFRIEDCRPDVLGLLPELLAACPRLLLKLSPMADISLVCRQIGHVREVHAVAAGGECKELLLAVERGYDGPCARVVCESGAVARPFAGPGGAPLVFAKPDDLQGWLFEPGKALLKAGAFDWPAQAFGLRKIGRHTHLYVSSRPIPEELVAFGKCFVIRTTAALNKAGLRQMAAAFPAAEVSARNLPMTSEELRKKLNVRPGGGVHLFGVHTDAPAGNYLLAAVPCKASIMADATASEAPEPPSSARTEA